MSKSSKFVQPSHRSNTKPGTPPNPSAKVPTWPSNKNKSCKYYDVETKTWNQPR